MCSPVQSIQLVNDYFCFPIYVLIQLTHWNFLPLASRATEQLSPGMDTVLQSLQSAKQDQGHLQYYLELADCVSSVWKMYFEIFCNLRKSPLQLFSSVFHLIKTCLFLISLFLKPQGGL